MTIHSGGNATCTKRAVCSDCGSEYGDFADHVFDQEVVKPEYLKSEATCLSKAIYYKSCECGERSDKDTFEYGDYADHDTFWDGGYGSSCTGWGFSGVLRCKTCHNTIRNGYSIAPHGHHVIKTKKVKPTCCSLGYKAHYECVYCGTCYKDKKLKKVVSKSKFKIKKKKHSYTKKIIAPQYLKKAATYKSPAVYRKACKWCGARGKKTFKYGKKLS